MRISLNWINELVNIKDVNFSQLIEKLTLGGFEVENTFEILLSLHSLLTRWDKQLELHNNLSAV